MSGSPLILALWNLGLLAVLGGLVWMVTWAIFGDGHWRTPRCPRCWHDMSGATSLRCSECGFAARSERALHRRRRHWGLALLAFAAMMSLALHLRTTWSAGGWTSILPSRVAIWLLPLAEANPWLREAREELGDRLMQGKLSAGDMRRVLERILSGDADAAPGTMAWQDKYGRLLDRWITLRLSARNTTSGQDDETWRDFEDVEARLARLPPVLSVSSPAVWVVDEPVPLDLMVRKPMATHVPHRLVVERTTLPASHPLLLPPVDESIMLNASPFLQTPVPLLLAPLPAGVHAGFLTVRVEAADDAGRWLQVASLEVPVGVRISETIPVPPPRPRFSPDGASEPIEGDHAVANGAPADHEEPRAFLPRRSEALDDAVRAFAAPGLVRWATGDRRFAMRFDPSRATMAPLRGVALGVEAEILEDGVVRRRIRVWWTGQGGLRFEPPQEDAEALARANTEDGRWTLRVRGVRELALRSALSAHPSGRRWWWDGEVTMPLNIEEIPTPALPRAWTIGPRPVEPREPEAAEAPDDGEPADDGAPPSGP